MPERAGFGRIAPMLGSVTVLLGLQIAGTYALALNEQPPASPALESVPGEIGAWKLVGEQAMEPEVAAYLKPDDYIDRNYLATGHAAQVNLFVAYFKSLKSGYGPHSPGICLPGAGWKPKQIDVVRAEVPGGLGSIPVNQYILEKDNENLLVLYWYQNERRTWAEEFRAKIFMLPDLLRYHRSDVALVRIITPMDARATEATKADLFQFVRTVFPLLSRQFASIS
jgi:EpsI family protein